MALTANFAVFADDDFRGFFGLQTDADLAASNLANTLAFALVIVVPLGVTVSEWTRTGTVTKTK